ncbi:MAG: ComF family protein [Deltaproteobacteria bacterium]|nr:ComF family protein [Deltaproteobacteria bacterium]
MLKIYRMPGLFDWTNLLKGCRDLLFPPRCLICNEFIIEVQARSRSVFKRPDICLNCWKGFIPLPPAHCSRCGQPFQTDLPSVHTCANCLKKVPAFDQALAAGLFQGTLRSAIHEFKYRLRMELVHSLADFMTRGLNPPFYPPEADLILPVPLHWRRLKERGFNQALLLANTLFSPWKDRVRYNLLARVRWTEPQIKFKGQERQRNVLRAFAVSRPENILDKSVILVDDVFTTGATANECARVLKKAGARYVLVLTLARVA